MLTAIMVFPIIFVSLEEARFQFARSGEYEASDTHSTQSRAVKRIIWASASSQSF
jgi:hypothetical protein